MAIAFDSQSTVNAITSTSLTFAFSNTAGDFLVVAGHDRNGASSLVTGVTYGGTALVAGPSIQTPSDRWITLWYWDNASAPPTGSNNVVVTASSSTALRFSAYSYSGVDYDNPLSGTGDTSSGTPVATLSTDVTTAHDNAWMLMFLKDNEGTGTYTSSTGDSVRLAADGGGHAYADTGAAISPAGANTMTLDRTGSWGLAAIAIGIKPAGGGGGGGSLSTLMLMGLG